MTGTTKHDPDGDTPDDDSLVELTGTIVKVFRALPGLGRKPVWSSGVIETDSGESERFSGKVYAVEQARLTLVGQWHDDEKYGRQLKVSHAADELELNLDGLVGYLSKDPKIQGIGPKRAQSIAESLGQEFEATLLEKPLEFLALSQLSETAKNSLKQLWQANHPTNAHRSWLYSYGLSYALVEQLIAIFDTSCLEVLREDPYILLDDDYPGFGFKRVDEIARAMGVPLDHPSRLAAVLSHIVTQELEDGHCWTAQSELFAKAARLLQTSHREEPPDMVESQLAEPDQDDLEAILETALTTQFKKKKLDHIVSEAEEKLVGLAELKRQESDLAQLFESAVRENPHLGARVESALDTTQATGELNDQQLQALRCAMEHGLCLISGKAGSGKTHVISELSRIYNQLGHKVVLAAPTGKAARRMEEASGQDAKTIHRLLGWDGQEFDVSRDEPLEADVIIIDECSMVDVPLAWNLFEAIDLAKTAVVLAGDHNQLPPVGPGNILRDLIDTQALPTVILDKIVRQAGQLPVNCSQILVGEVPESTPPDEDDHVAWAVKDTLETPGEVLDYLLELFDTRLQARGFDLLKDVQVLSPQKPGPIGTQNLNRELQRLIQKKLWGIEVDASDGEPALLKNDKVIQTANDYNLGENGIMNGTIGYVTERKANGSITIDFDGEAIKLRPKAAAQKNLQLAYALTIHKAQGSEFPCAVLVMHRSHSYMHHRNLFYTGVTRAQITSIIVGDRSGIERCAEHVETDRRRTFLSQLLLPAGAKSAASATPPARQLSMSP